MYLEGKCKQCYTNRSFEVAEDFLGASLSFPEYQLSQVSNVLRSMEWLKCICRINNNTNTHQFQII